MKKIATIISLILITFNINAATKTKLKNITFNEEKNKYFCEYKDVKRSYIICLPEKYDNQTSLIIMLHGLGMSAESFMEITQMEKYANPRNYAVVYVDAVLNPKNRTYGTGWHYFDDKFSVNDVDFIVELGKYCQAEFGLSSRVFAGGFSNGAFMVNKLLATKAYYFTAGVSVAGTMQKNIWNEKSGNPVGYLQINGTKDDVVPMDFLGSSQYSPNPSMEKVIEYYVSVNNVPKEYELIQISDVAKMYNFSSKVGWIIIQDGRHNWPNIEFSKFEAGDVILDFFDKL